MGRDAKLTGDHTPMYISDIDAAHRAVEMKYRPCVREGSTGTYTWRRRDRKTDEIVAEAWAHRTRPGWNLRIKRY